MKKLSVIGGDKRFALLARQLAERGCEVQTFGLERFGAGSAVPLNAAVRAPRVILPLPLSREAGYLNCAEEKIPLEELWRQFAPEQNLYAGGVRAEDKETAEKFGLHLTDYLAREELAIYNAVPTAEGAIAAAMEATAFTLHGASCFVIGYGRIGKVLAQYLQSLGAAVSVSARRRSDLAWIEVRGYQALHTGKLDGKLGEFQLIFNTVPHLVLGEELLAQLRPDCVLIELASVSGFDAAVAARLGLLHVQALGLPGKVAPESAARAICHTLYNIWEEEE